MDRRHLAIAAALLGIGCLATFAGLWQAGPSSHVAVQPVEGRFAVTRRADATFQAWLVARHARTLVTRPWRLIDTEHCAPAEDTLTLGIPMVTLGVLAIPGALLSDEPVLVYNVALVLLTLVSGLAMYLLVARWSGVPAAGWVAALWFAFQPLRLGHMTHPSVWDASWTVLALYFAERLSAEGRWRDAAGLGASIAAQVGASFYPLLAAALIAPPFAIWLALRDRGRALRAGPVALVAALAALAVLVVLVPYLGAETDRGGLWRTRFLYLDPVSLLRPDRLEFPGFTVIAASLVGLLVPARRALAGIRGDPRPALLVGAIAVVLVASGPGHAWLADVVPGLGAVRGIERLVAGASLVWILFAGLGVGVLVRAAGGRGAYVAAALLAIVAFDVLRMPALGFERRYAWDFEAVRPAQEEIDYFRLLGETLDRRDEPGALLELPFTRPSQLVENTRRILLSAWHGHRTSACFGSYRPPGLIALGVVAQRLPGDAALRAAREQGFGSVVVHGIDADRRAARIAAGMRRAVRDGALVPVLEDERHAAWRLVPPAEAEASPAAPTR